MRVGFFVETPGPHLEVSQYLIESVRKTMPGVEVWFLSNESCPRPPGVDGVVRVCGDYPMAVRRMKAHSMLYGDWLFVDSDVVINRDVRYMFDSEFDICLTDRVGSDMEHLPYGKQMPYNIGVVFSRSPEFWADVLDALLALPPKLQRWTGDQLVVCGMAERDGVKIIPGAIYNYSPTHKGDDCSGAAIVHYKGSRKLWLGANANN